MNWVLSDSRPVARKIYECNACLFLLEALPHEEFTCAELRSIVRARRDGWRILPGQRYIRQVQKFEGDIVTVRSRPEIDAICHKYKLYGDWW